MRTPKHKLTCPVRVCLPLRSLTIAPPPPPECFFCQQSAPLRIVSCGMEAIAQARHGHPKTSLPYRWLLRCDKFLTQCFRRLLRV